MPALRAANALGRLTPATKAASSALVVACPAATGTGLAGGTSAAVARTAGRTALASRDVVGTFVVRQTRTSSEAATCRLGRPRASVVTGIACLTLLAGRSGAASTGTLAPASGRTYTPTARTRLATPGAAREASPVTGASEAGAPTSIAKPGATRRNAPKGTGSSTRAAWSAARTTLRAGVPDGRARGSGRATAGVEAEEA